MRFYQKFQYSYQYNYNTSTNLISRIQNNTWNKWKFSGVKKYLYMVFYTVYLYYGYWEFYKVFYLAKIWVVVLSSSKLVAYASVVINEFCKCFVRWKIV